MNIPSFIARGFCLMSFTKKELLEEAEIVSREILAWGKIPCKKIKNSHSKAVISSKLISLHSQLIAIENNHNQ